MKEIILVRHAESRSNTGEIAPHRDGDHHIALTELGLRQANAVGHQFSKYFFADSVNLLLAVFAGARNAHRDSPSA